MEREEHFELLGLFTAVDMAFTEASLYPQDARRCLERSGKTQRKLQDAKEAYLKSYSEKYGIYYYDDVLNRINGEGYWKGPWKPN